MIIPAQKSPIETHRPRFKIFSFIMMVKTSLVLKYAKSLPLENRGQEIKKIINFNGLYKYGF